MCFIGRFLRGFSDLGGPFLLDVSIPSQTLSTLFGFTKTPLTRVSEGYLENTCFLRNRVCVADVKGQSRVKNG